MTGFCQTKCCGHDTLGAWLSEHPFGGCSRTVHFGKLLEFVSQHTLLEAHSKASLLAGAFPSVSLSKLKFVQLPTALGGERYLPCWAEAPREAERLAQRRLQGAQCRLEGVTPSFWLSATLLPTHGSHPVCVGRGGEGRTPQRRVPVSSGARFLDSLSCPGPQPSTGARLPISSFNPQLLFPKLLTPKRQERKRVAEKGRAENKRGFSMCPRSRGKYQKASGRGAWGAGQMTSLFCASVSLTVKSGQCMVSRPDFSDRISLVGGGGGGGSSVCCRAFSSTLVSDSPDASSARLPGCDNQTGLGHWQTSPGEQTAPPGELLAGRSEACLFRRPTFTRASSGLSVNRHLDGAVPKSDPASGAGQGPATQMEARAAGLDRHRTYPYPLLLGGPQHPPDSGTLLTLRVHKGLRGALPFPPHQEENVLKIFLFN